MTKGGPGWRLGRDGVGLIQRIKVKSSGSRPTTEESRYPHSAAIASSSASKSAAARKRSASSAAMHPVPAAVIAWR